MHTISVQQPINLKVVRFELDFTPYLPQNTKPVKKSKQVKVPDVRCVSKKSSVPPPPAIKVNTQKRGVKDLIEELLDELYADHRDWSTSSSIYYSRGSTSVASVTSSQSNCGEQTDAIERNYLEALSIKELQEQADGWQTRLKTTGDRLARCLRARDRLKRQQSRLCAAFTILLRHISA